MYVMWAFWAIADSFDTTCKLPPTCLYTPEVLQLNHKHVPI
jgi:hypothetical protein